MNDTEIRIAIAEACGRNGWWCPQCKKLVSEYSLGYQLRHANCTESARQMPDYPNDLNAMHEAIKTLNKRQLYRFSYELCALTGFNFTDFDANSNSDLTYLICASARQWAEAFLRTIGKWVVL